MLGLDQELGGRVGSLLLEAAVRCKDDALIHLHAHRSEFLGCVVSEAMLANPHDPTARVASKQLGDESRDRATFADTGGVAEEKGTTDFERIEDATDRLMLPRRQSLVSSESRLFYRRLCHRRQVYRFAHVGGMRMKLSCQT